MNISPGSGIPVAMDISPQRPIPVTPLGGSISPHGLSPLYPSSEFSLNPSPSAMNLSPGYRVPSLPVPGFPPTASPFRVGELSPRTILFGNSPPIPVTPVMDISPRTPLIPISPKSPGRTVPQIRTTPFSIATPLMRSKGIGYNPNVDLSQYGVDIRRTGFFGNIERIARDNNMFRKVIFTSEHEQIVVMSLEAGENIGSEIHQTTDQFFRIESGSGVFHMGNPRIARLEGYQTSIEEIDFRDGDSLQVPAGLEHNVLAKTPVKLYTIYSPPQHNYDTIDVTYDDSRMREM